LLGGKLITKLELHLLEYKQRELEYLQFFGHRHVSPFQTVSLKAFSSPFDVEGYADNSITDDLVTDLFLEFSERSRQIESEKYVRTLTGVYPIPPTMLRIALGAAPATQTISFEDEEVLRGGSFECDRGMVRTRLILKYNVSKRSFYTYES
jgi:hypothetical protein